MQRKFYVMYMLMAYAGYCVVSFFFHDSAYGVERHLAPQTVPKHVGELEARNDGHMNAAIPNHVTAAPPDHVTAATSEHVTKVILYTYMRSGSTLTGEFLAQDPDTFYLFEMVDGMYSHMYGTKSGMYPIDIFYYTDGTKRPLPDTEKQFVVDTSLQLLSCNFSLPADVTFQRFMVERRFPSTTNYVQCLLRKELGQAVKEPKNCKPSIANYCPQYFDRAAKTPESCYNHFHVNPNPSYAQILGFKTHQECMEKAEKRALECREILTQACLQRKVRSFKAIRLSMEVVEAMIRREPALRIVYLVRDPRGIVRSRQSTREMSVTSGKQLQKEAEVLCHRMAFDASLYEDLVTRYPQNILRVRYEDIATQPMEQAQSIYKFTRDMSVPDTVRTFIQKSMNGSTNDGSYGTSRKNATATAFSWRTKLTGQQIADINNVCRAVIAKLGYTL